MVKLFSCTPTAVLRRCSVQNSFIFVNVTQLPPSWLARFCFLIRKSGSFLMTKHHALLCALRQKLEFELSGLIRFRGMFAIHTVNTFSFPRQQWFREGAHCRIDLRFAPCILYKNVAVFAIGFAAKVLRSFDMQMPVRHNDGLWDLLFLPDKTCYQHHWIDHNKDHW